ncbi:hypothetical protein ACHAWU_008559 [Discostella pseudostelligera]|uniref:Anaphase-promoting complex subunit 5 n=1 Tax=Discostella pseudostelligera TaxID=259834 RepID=A0ABD3MEL3_9STRA
MADLPTPHSIAIGTLLSLYSDPHSPLIDWRRTSRKSSAAGTDVDYDGDDENRDHDVIGDDDGDDDDGRPRSTAEWTLRLMQLLQQLVLREDEGVIIFPNSDLLLFRGDDDTDYKHGCDADGFAPATTTSRVDPIHIIEDNECNNITMNKTIKHGAITQLISSGAGSGSGDLLDDILFDMFPPHNRNTNDTIEMNNKSLSPSDFLPISSNVIDVNASLFVGQELHLDHNHDSSLNFCMETLSTLLDRIDDAFLHGDGASSVAAAVPSKRLNGRKRGGSGLKWKRTPPSQALLKRLQMASTSVDDLMNILDEWHAMLEGTPLPYSSATSTIIAMDGESTFGIYLRKLCLGMEEIPFEALSRLWDALRKFVEEEIASQQCEAPLESHQPDDITADGHNSDHYINHEQDIWNATMPVYDWLPSSPQIERIVRNTCLNPNLDSLLVKPPRSRSQPSPSRQSSQRLHNLLETHPECPSVHFLMYLSSLANGYRSQALECLHRYFDYAMIHERKERAERTLMLQASAIEGGGGAMTTSGGIMGTIASGMGGITGGMTGGIINGRMMHGGPAMGQQQVRAGAGGGAAGPGGGGQAATVKIFKESNVMQYAAILLAQTYYRFGYARLSLQATEEAIRVAQQSGDEECVCFANAWSALVSSSLGGNGGVGANTDCGIGERRSGTSVYASVGGIEGSGVLQHGGYSRPLVPLHASLNSRRRRREEEALLRRCRARASERGLSLLAASTSLEMARLLAYRRHHGDDDGEGADGLGGSSGREDDSPFGCVASSAWDSVQAAGRMFVVGSGGPSPSSTGRGIIGHRQSGATMSLAFGQPAPTDIYDMTPTEATSILRQQNIAIAGLWESTGHISLSALSSSAALHETSGRWLDSIVWDERGNRLSSLALNRVLSSNLNGPGLVAGTKKGNGIEESRLDHQHFGQAYATILKSVASLGNAELLLKSSVATSTLHEWSVRSYDLSLAQGMNILLANRAAFPCPHTAAGGGGTLPAVESTLEFLTQSSHLSRQRGEFDKAKAFTRRACWLANQHGLLFHLGSNLLQLSLIELDCACTATSAPERSLPPLLECLELSEQFSMDPLRALALSTLSKVMLCMGGGYRKARALLRASFPLVMQHGHVWFQGEAFLTLAKCYLAEATARENPNSVRAKNSTTLNLRKSALFELKRSADKFELIEDIQRLREVFYLRARVYQLLPNSRKERDDAANIFARLTVAMRERVRNPTMTALTTCNL